jgi:uncharacterized protein (DUF433 family)
LSGGEGGRGKKHYKSGKVLNLCIKIIKSCIQMKWQDYIISDKDVLLGKPIVKGSRISIELILELMSNGWTEKMILESYPTLTEDDIKAVFAFLRDKS